MPPPKRRTRSASPDTLTTCLERLRSLPRISWPPVSDRGHAAVVAVLFDCARDATPRLLLSRRANLRSHSGEVALPGGRRDPEDVETANGGGAGSGDGGSGATASRDGPTVPASAAKPASSPSSSSPSSPSQRPLPLSVDAVTALREAHEEIGLEPSQLEVVAELPPLLSKHLLSVAVVVAALREQPESVEGLLRSLAPSPSEVDAAFEAPLAYFLDPPNSSATAARSAAGVTRKEKGQKEEEEKEEKEEKKNEKKNSEPAENRSSPPPPPPSCSYSFRDARFGRVKTAPRFRLHFFDMRSRPCVFSSGPKGVETKDDFLVWGLTAGIAVEVARAALGRPPLFEVAPARAPHYSRICCFRDRNGGMPMVMEEGEGAKKRKR